MLPSLRRELTLLEGSPSVTGEPRWLIHDPLQHRYIQIDEVTHLVLAVWSQCRTVDELLERVEASGRFAGDQASIGKFIEFVQRHKLTDPQAEGTWKTLAAENARSTRSPFSWLAHNYLFFKVPLWQPQAFLERTLPLARIAMARWFIGLVAGIGCLGLYLVSRQWDAFASTFQFVFTWEGALTTIVALAIVKVLHEMGHAYSAVYYGCRVPTMGLAFMLMAPLLYTDVTDAWRLREHRQRLVIAAAGVLVELGVACICLFAWAVLPDGPLRSVAFVLAATSLLTSLFINLNPLMRFDGYYLLADWLGIENLQDRSIDVARWDLRERLFRLRAACPEQLPARYVRTLLVYAWCVWLYRLFLFIGIALIVYNYFFKALGILLFCLEIGYFIARPLWSELKIWYALRASIYASRRSGLTVGVAAALILVCIIPWSTRVEIPAVLEPESLMRIFPPRAARIVSVHVTHGQSVEAGAVLVTLSSPDIGKEIDVSLIKLRLARMQHARRIADATDREASLELESTVASLNNRIEGLEREQQELVIRAPFSGRIAEINPDLHPDRWISVKDMLAVVVDTRRWVARGYVAEESLWRVAKGLNGTFVPEQPQRPNMDASIVDISVGAVGQIEILDLASIHGGRIAVVPDEKRRLVPISAQYPVYAKVETRGRLPELIERGVMVVEGQSESFASRVARRSLSVLVRESGF